MGQHGKAEAGAEELHGSQVGDYADALIEIATKWVPSDDGGLSYCWCWHCGQDLVDGCEADCPGLLARKALGLGAEMYRRNAQLARAEAERAEAVDLLRLVLAHADLTMNPMLWTDTQAFLARVEDGERA